jgi:glutaredoxin 3
MLLGCLVLCQAFVSASSARAHQQLLLASRLAPSRPASLPWVRCMVSESEVLSKESSILAAIERVPCLVYSTTTCPFCAKAKSALDELGAEYSVIELDELVDHGVAARSELLHVTGRTSVPAVFIGGEFAGGCNDGGLGGVITLQQERRLIPLLERAGALAPGAADPVAALFSTLFGGGSGKRIWFGVLQQQVDPGTVPTDTVRAERRATAAAALTNIDDDERERRRLAGSVLGVLTAAIAVGMVAGDASALTRAAIAPPLFLSYGFLMSAREGL